MSLKKIRHYTTASPDSRSFASQMRLPTGTGLVDLIDVKRGMNRNQIGLSTIDRAQTCDLTIPIFKSNQKRVGIARRRGWTSKRLFDHASARVVLIEVKWSLALACNVCGTNAEGTPPVLGETICARWCYRLLALRFRCRSAKIRSPAKAKFG
jgi:hypothetical protein